MCFVIDGINEGASVDYLRELVMYMVVLAIAGVVFRILSRVNIFFLVCDVEMDFCKDFFGFYLWVGSMVRILEYGSIME